MSPRTMDFREFALQHGVDPNGYCEPALHNPMGFIPKAAHRRHMRLLLQRQGEHAAKLALVRAEYDRLVEAGDLAPLTGLDRLKRAAAGPDDRESTQAARRILARLAHRAPTA